MDRFEITNNIRIYKYIFLFSIILIFSLLFYQSYQQYQIWSGDAFSKFLLPPHQSIGYFLGYSFTHFFKNYLISLGAGLLFLLGAVLFNNRFQKRFFEEEEPYLGALAIFVVGHPLWIYYLVAIFSIGLAGSLFFRLTSSRVNELIPEEKLAKPVNSLINNKNNLRFPFYYFWLPVAIIIMIIWKILV